MITFTHYCDWMYENGYTCVCTHTQVKYWYPFPRYIAHLDIVTMKVCVQKSMLYIISVYCHLLHTVANCCEQIVLYWGFDWIYFFKRKFSRLNIVPTSNNIWNVKNAPTWNFITIFGKRDIFLYLPCTVVTLNVL